MLSLEKLCEEHGYTYHWKSGQNPHLIKNGKRIDCNLSNYVPFVVNGISASSSSTKSSPTSPSSASQDSVFDVNRYTENPVPERSGSTSGELQGDPLHETTETENQNKNRESKEVQRESYRMNCLIGCRNSERIWLMKVLQQSLGETQSKDVKTLPSDLHELPMEPLAKVEPGSGKHSVKTHFPKDPELLCLLEDENNKGVLQNTR